MKERNYDDFENNRMLRKKFRKEKDDKPKNFGLYL